MPSLRLALATGLAVSLAIPDSGPLLAQRAPRPAAAAATPAAIDTAALRGLKVRMLGPFRGGRSTAVAGIPGQPHAFFMGSTGGGLWHTDDAGATWRNVSDGWFGGAIGSGGRGAGDPNVVYVGEGSVDVRGNTSHGTGAWRSTDGGRSWQSMGFRNAGQIGRIQVHPANPDLVVRRRAGPPVRAQPGARRVPLEGRRPTVGQGAVPQRLHRRGGLAMNPRNPRILYAAMWRAERKPWTMISGSAEGGIWRSVDGGDTWKKLGGGLPEGVTGKIGLTVSPANPQPVWAIVEAEPLGGVYRSDDGGDTWTRTNSENKLRQRAWYYTHVRADPPKRTWCTRSTRRCIRHRWGSELHAGRRAARRRARPVDQPADKRIMIVADDGGAQVSLNRGRTWSTYWNQPTAEFYDVITDNRFPYRVYTAQQDNTMPSACPAGRRQLRCIPSPTTGMPPGAKPARWRCTPTNPM
jgi:hypothetical protein